MDQVDHEQWAALEPDELGTTTIGRSIRFFPSVGSTNNLLKDEARGGAAEGLVFVTDEQVAGRGRRGRSWTAPTGTSLLVSVLLRPTWLPPTNAFLLTSLAAVAAAEALETTGITIDLKWPNDLQITGRKLGGILVESEISADQLHWVVVGCGINVNWDPRVVPELATTATSLSAELGHIVPRRPLFQALLQAFDRHYLALRYGARSALFDVWRAKLSTLGQPVLAETPQGPLHGVAEDVMPDGALLIRDAQGQQHLVMAGDVSIRPKK